jgi:hypothetical protein
MQKLRRSFDPENISIRPAESKAGELISRASRLQRIDRHRASAEGCDSYRMRPWSF